MSKTSLRKINQQQHFELIGRITAQYGHLEQEVFLILSKLVGSRFGEVSYYFTDKNKSITGKFKAVIELIKLKPYCNNFSDDLIESFKSANKELSEISTKKNKLSHNISVLSYAEGMLKLQSKKFNNRWEFETIDEYSIDELWDLHTEVFLLSQVMNSINNQVIESLKLINKDI